MSNKIYDIDYDKLLNWLLPNRMRRDRAIAYLKIVISSVRTLYPDFIRFRDAKRYQLMITPQVCYLERLLNDRFDFIQRAIHIIDGTSQTPLYLFQQAELNPLYTKTIAENSPQWLYHDYESFLNQGDFIIVLPLYVAINIDYNELKSLVNAYKLAGKNYQIQII